MVSELEKLDIVILGKEIDIYNKIKKAKQEKTKREILKGFGMVPLSFMSLIASISLTYSSIYYIFLFKENNIPTYEPFYTLFIIGLSISLFLLYIYIFILSISLFTTSWSLNKNDKKL